MTSWIYENWYLVFGVLCVGLTAGFAIGRFLLLPSEDQLEKMKEWLVFAVTEAEKELGNGTGQLKLRMVYGMFIDKFPWYVKVMTFEDFSKLVDEALEEMRNMLQNNKAVKEFIER